MKPAYMSVSVLQNALELSLNGFDIVDDSGVFIYVNKAYVDMWGYDSAEEILGTSPASHCADPEIPQRIITALKTEGKCDIEFEALRKDGSTFMVRMLAYIAHDAIGREIYPSTSIDITEEYRRRENAKEAEARFRRMVDESPAMIWITDTESRCIYLSKRWYEFTGRTPELDLGVGWVQNVHPNDRQLAADVYLNAVREAGELRVDYRLRQKDGRYRWMLDLGYPRFDEKGEFAGYIGTVTDIHDRVIAEHQLLDATERFRMVAKASGVGVWYCDLPFDVLEWDEVVKAHFFLPPDARVTIETFYERIHPDDREPTRLAIQASNEGRKAYDIHYRTTNPQNPSDCKWIRAIGWTDYNSKGQPIRFDGLTLDATEEFRRNEEILRARDEAQAANQLKSEFLANMSHEIRTPLGAMLGFAELIKSHELSVQEEEEFLEILLRNGRQLEVLINDILDLSKVEAGHLIIENESTDLKDVAQHVVTLLSLRSEEKTLDLSFSADCQLPANFHTDALRVRQVLLNIVSNAIKFTMQGSVRVTLQCRTDESGVAWADFRIRDTGIGIAPEKQEQIFGAFVQADGSHSRRFGGTGLGLTLSRKLARFMGGEVVLESSSEKGSTFRFSVPNQQRS